MLRRRDAAATRYGGNGDRNRDRDDNGGDDDNGDRDRDGDGDGDGDDDGDGNDAPCASPPPFTPTDVAFGTRAMATWPATAPGGALPTAAELRAALSARRLEHDQEAIVFTTLRDAPVATEGYAGLRVRARPPRTKGDITRTARPSCRSSYTTAPGRRRARSAPATRSTTSSNHLAVGIKRTNRR